MSPPLALHPHHISCPSSFCSPLISPWLLLRCWPIDPAAVSHTLVDRCVRRPEERCPFILPMMGKHETSAWGVLCPYASCALLPTKSGLLVTLSHPILTQCALSPRAPSLAQWPCGPLRNLFCSLSRSPTRSFASPICLALLPFALLCSCSIAMGFSFS